MKLNAVGVTTSNVKKTVAVYQLLGFEFPAFEDEEQHVEAVTTERSARLMIDSRDMIKDILGEEPKPGNHSSFAIQYDSPQEVNEISKKITDSGFSAIKEPWDAFWGQRYAVVEDPDGYKIDLYASL